MQANNLPEQLMRHIDAGFPFIYINTFEDGKADEIISKVAKSIRFEVCEWDAASGHAFWSFNQARFVKCQGLGKCTISHMIDTLSESDELGQKLIVIRDFQNYADEPEVLSRLKNLANSIIGGLNTTVIFISSVVVIPVEIENYITIFDIGYPDSDEIKEIINRFAEENPQEKLSSSLLDEMKSALKGLSEFEINSVLSLAYARDGTLHKSDISIIHEHKKQIVMKSGNLEMIDANEGKESIGGLDVLKSWLENKAKVYQNLDKAIEYGVDIPRGVLMVGVPGCGKSLSAKVAANLFKIPLLRLDLGRLLGKYVGESEANMRRAIALAEAISPCVLWVDELEKAFAGIGGDGGGAEVTTRLFGNFLTWMQEKKSATFVVATANNIAKLPPELMRKGRFDEIFYIELPNDTERKQIFNIHIKKRRKADLEAIDISKLAEKTGGYCGADIEGVVRESVEISFVTGAGKLTTDTIVNVIDGTHSLSDIMSDEIREMQRECNKRKFRKASK